MGGLYCTILVKDRRHDINCVLITVLVIAFDMRRVATEDIRCDGKRVDTHYCWSSKLGMNRRL